MKVNLFPSEKICWGARCQSANPMEGKRIANQTLSGKARTYSPRQSSSSQMPLTVARGIASKIKDIGAWKKLLPYMTNVIRVINVHKTAASQFGPERSGVLSTKRERKLFFPR